MSFPSIKPRREPLRITALILVAGLIVLGGPAPAQAGTEPGPAYSVDRDTMDAALSCSGELDEGPTPVLFIHGTTSNSKANWSWNWNRELTSRNWTYCNVDMPLSGNADAQISAEYVTRAIRSMSERAGRKISIVGHSQGGMIARWSLKYWPDTRSMVDDYVSLAPSNHGTRLFNLQCALPIGCPAANWQQREHSKFLNALNSGQETWDEVDYTVVTTNLDEIVMPSALGRLTPGPNVMNTSVQQLCSLEIVEHFGMAYDNAAWLIGLDALTHDGPALLSRVPRRCGNPFMPGVAVATAPIGLAAALLQSAVAIATATNLHSEPGLRDYAR